MAYNLPKIDLSPDEQTWLGIVSKQFLGGYLADVELLKKSLHAQGKWPRGFRPSEIDRRLLWEKNRPTLLGIWHAYPTSVWVEKCDHLIRYIKDKVSTSTPTQIKVAEIAAAIGITERSVSVLIHLLPSLGLYYTATVTPPRRDVVRIPGELDMYASLQFDDPEKIDDYLSYENIEEQIKKVSGEDIAETPETSTDAPLSNTEKFSYANQLYDKVKRLAHNITQLDRDNARLVVELADDAIKEYGNTNQEKKVELRQWKSQAELVLPPATVEELRKRAEGQLLKKSYPRHKSLRNLLLAAAATLVIVSGLMALRQILPGSATTTPSPAPSQKLEEMPQDLIPKLSGIEINSPDRSLEVTVLNETNWTVKEIFVEFTAFNQAHQSIGYKSNFRLGLMPESSGDPYRVSKFIGELGIDWGGTKPLFQLRITGAKGIKPVS